MGSNEEGHIMNNIQAFIDAGDVFDIAVEEGRLLHYNGAQAYIRMWPKRNTVMIIDFSAATEPDIKVWLSEQYVNNNCHSGKHYQESLKDFSLKEFLYSHYKENVNA